MNPETEKPQALTRFLCQELLYEFVIGKLDADRQRQMDEYLTTCRDSQHELERLRRGFVFSSQMAKTQMSAEMHQALLGFEPAWKRKLAQWTAWWSRRGWKLLPYFVIAGTLILGAIVMKPWRLLTVKEVVLVEEAKPDSNKTKEEPKESRSADAQAAKTDGANASAGAAAPAGAGQAAASLETAPPIEETKVETETTEVDPAKLMMASAQATGAVETDPAAQAAGGEAISADIPAEEKRPAKKIVLRGTLETGDFANVWPAVRDKIVSLDGKVIGAAALGSQRRAGEAYFHFSLPESKQEEFESFLKTFGPVRFSKQADKRAMPEGENHIILTVKDGGPREERKETASP